MARIRKTSGAPTQFKNDDREIGKTNWKNVVKPTATDWYRVVVTVKLSDGTKGEQKTNANNEKYTEGTGVQTCYIEKIDAVSSKADLVANKNYYSYNLPYWPDRHYQPQPRHRARRLLYLERRGQHRDLLQQRHGIQVQYV